MSKLRLRNPGSNSDWMKFTCLQCVYWFAMSVGNYQTVFFQQRGLPASAIGLFNAVLSAVTILITPVWGMVSDRIRSIRRVFLLTLIVGNAAFAFIPAVAGLPFPGTAPLLCYLCCVYAFRNPANSLLDNWLVRCSNQKQLNYGTIRSFGSLSFAICGAAISGLVTAYGTAWTFPVCAALMIPAVLVSLRTGDAVVEAEPSDGRRRESFNPLELFKNYYFVTFLAFAFLLCVVTNGASAFLPYLLSDIGVPGSRYGVITAYMAMLEIPMLVAAGPLRRRIPLYALAIASACSYATACVLLGTSVRSLASVVAAETMSGIGSGLLIASAANYIYTLTPNHLKATGQSIYAAVTSMSAILGNLAGGAVVDALGAKALYRILSGVGLSAACLLVATIVLGVRALKLNAPNKTY